MGKILVQLSLCYTSVMQTQGQHTFHLMHVCVLRNEIIMMWGILSLPGPLAKSINQHQSVLYLGV